ncbi:vacuole membrane protein 1-like [Sycon ciliatum]|uniref:vacuole membrane protein 1-like n=1 Tax=Sycon ciliatum TaxID=27933 RepID=UPI0031F6FB18
METDSLRRSPRRTTSSRSRQAAAVASPVYDQSTASELKQELESRGVQAPERATKRQLFNLLAESNSASLYEGEQNRNGTTPTASEASAGQERMIPMSMTAAEREEHEDQQERINGYDTAAAASQATPTHTTATTYADSLLLWKRPLSTLYHFALEFKYQSSNLLVYLSRRWQFVAFVGLLSAVLAVASVIDGAHTPYIVSLRSSFIWYGWWVGLGILSSVGLGTGLHTFVLYLGPHIAAVTLAAWSCMSVDFPAPPYPAALICPEGSPAVGAVMSLWTIMSKVRWEAMMWGAGTAIGELPPYFVARAARLAGQEMDPELEEAMNADDKSFTGRAKLFLHHLIQRVGFWGIFLAASIPNPLFDLAGITCGHFLVPFPTFFGATLLGKAVVKMHLQKVLVIFLFTKSHFESLIHLIGRIPSVGSHLQKPFMDFLEKQKTKYHRQMGAGSDEDTTSLFSYVYGLLVISMISYFLLSILHSMAKQNAARHLSSKSK